MLKRQVDCVIDITVAVTIIMMMQKIMVSNIFKTTNLPYMNNMYEIIAFIKMINGVYIFLC